MDELPGPQHIHPQPQQECQFPLCLVLFRVVLQHALKGRQFGEHGEQERIEVACDGAAVLRAHHLYLGTAGHDLAFERGPLESHELRGFVDITGSEPGIEGSSDMIFGGVVVLQELFDFVNLSVTCQKKNCSVGIGLKAGTVPWQLLSLPLLVLFALASQTRA